MTEISSAFRDAWTSSGTLVVTCACGRTHFATYANEGFFDDDELEGLRQKASIDADNYVEHNDDSHVSYLHIAKGIVIGCACKQDVKYEQFIWHHRDSIIEYLTARNKHDLEVVTHLNEKLKALNELQTNNGHLVLGESQA